MAALAGTGILWFSLPGWTLAAAVAVWAIKDCALYPFVKSAYEGPKPTGPDALVGSLGTAVGDLLPRGFVRIGPELWRAESSVHTSAGQPVRVVSCEGMTMRVEPVHSGEKSASRAGGSDTRAD